MAEDDFDPYWLDKEQAARMEAARAESARLSATLPSIADYNLQVDKVDTQVNSYLADYVAEMRRRGFTVTVGPDQSADALMYNLAPSYQVTLQKQGVIVDTLIGAHSLSTPVQQTADGDQRFKWGVTAAQQGLAGNGGQQTADFWNAMPVTVPGAIPMTPAPITPNPPTTMSVVQANVSNVQSQQAPRTPDAGTAQQQSNVAPTATDTLYNFDEWNWFYQQQTGRAGPAPEDVGVADRTERITLERWRAIVAPWFAAQGETVNETTGGGSTGGGSTGGGSTGGGSTGGGSTGGGSTGGGVAGNTRMTGTDHLLVLGGLLVVGYFMGKA